MTEASTYLGFTILYVPDVEAAIAFYEQAFGLSRSFVTDTKEYGELNTGITNDVKALYQRAIQAGATQIKKPQQKPWGQIVSYVRDLNGFLGEICTAVKAPAL